MPDLALPAFSPARVIEIGDRAFVQHRIAALDIDLRQRHPQQRRRGRQLDGILIGPHRLAHPSVLEQHLSLELAVIGIVRKVPDQPVDFRQRPVKLRDAVISDRPRVARER